MIGQLSIASSAKHDHDARMIGDLLLRCTLVPAILLSLCIASSSTLIHSSSRRFGIALTFRHSAANNNAGLLKSDTSCILHVYVI